MPANLDIAPAALDVQSTLLVSRCRCGGSPKRYQSDQGYYYLCQQNCNCPGSGMYRDPADAGRAWNDLQAARK